MKKKALGIIKGRVFLMFLISAYVITGAITSQGIYGETVLQSVYNGNGSITDNDLYPINNFTGAITSQSVHGKTVTEVVYSGNGEITDNGTYQLASDFTGEITIANTVTEVEIIGNGSQHQHTSTNIIAADGRTAALNLTIEDLNILASSDIHAIGFGEAGNYPHKLYLRGESVIKGGFEAAGIHVPSGISLTINSEAGEHLGKLTVTGGENGAGIGGGSSGAGGTITIIGGNVTATGGSGDSSGGAGIGGGGSGAGGTITIIGGNVTATGGSGDSSGGAGIGGGGNGAGGVITITGGDVTAEGGYQGAGIGGGGMGAGVAITITGGRVTAEGGLMSAGIGGGMFGAGGAITIAGGRVTATGGNGVTGGGAGAGIGGGRRGSSGIITIAGGIVTATGGQQRVSGGAGIGGGNVGASDSITILDGDVTAEGSDGGAGIGGGSMGGAGGIITIAGGRVTATGSGLGAGIGGGSRGQGGTVTISGMNTVVDANGGESSGSYTIGSSADFLDDSYNGGSLIVSDEAVVNLNNGGTNASTTFTTCTIGGDGSGSLAGYYLNGIKLDEPPTPGIGRYTVTPASDSSYSIGTTADGISTMTVNEGVAGFKYFEVNITPLAAHSEDAVVIFVQFRDHEQLSMNTTKADFDRVNKAMAGFNVQAGDVIKVYIVDNLTNDSSFNPILLQ